MNKIIVFGNQKGGVGKTTLCTLFANYLSAKNLSILVIDCDGQQTIFEKRQTDIKKFGKDVFRYNIQTFSIEDEFKVKILMENLRTMDGIILIDSPGNLAQQALIPLFAYSDYIICPYQYEPSCVNSTVTFTVFIKKLEAKSKTMKSRMFFVPNKYDCRIGRKEELELWRRTDLAFGEQGLNTPKIKAKADLQRYNTVGISESVKKDVCPTFDFIYSNIFNIQSL